MGDILQPHCTATALGDTQSWSLSSGTTRQAQGCPGRLLFRAAYPPPSPGVCSFHLLRVLEPGLPEASKVSVPKRLSH